MKLPRPISELVLGLVRQGGSTPVGGGEPPAEPVVLVSAAPQGQQGSTPESS